MELAKISKKGQITVPKDIREKLNLKAGDKVLFIEDENGQVVISNASQVALAEIQKGMRGAAERAGINSEDEVQALAKEVRRKLWEEKDADYD